MKIIVCVDNSLGITFGGRRVSRDREIIADITKLVGDNRLLMNGYSAKLFADFGVTADENYLQNAYTEDYCFYEGGDLSPYADKINAVIIYRFNRDYPADVFFDFNTENYEKSESVEFVGKSHDIIQRDTYIKEVIE